MFHLCTGLIIRSNLQLLILQLSPNFSKQKTLKTTASYNCFDPTCGGEELYTQTVFVFQSILADRYIRRREM